MPLTKLFDYYRDIIIMMSAMKNIVRVISPLSAQAD